MGDVRRKKEEDINFKEEKVALKTLQNSVTATGTIEAVTSVTVGTQVSGIVNKLYVDYNSQVKGTGHRRTRQDQSPERTEYCEGKPSQRTEQSELSGSQYGALQNSLQEGTCQRR